MQSRHLLSTSSTKRTTINGLGVGPQEIENKISEFQNKFKQIFAREKNLGTFLIGLYKEKQFRATPRKNKFQKAT